MRHITVGDSINTSSRSIRGWLGGCSLLGLLFFAGCDVTVEDDHDGVDVIEIEEPDAPDVEIDGPDVHVD